MRRLFVGTISFSLLALGAVKSIAQEGQLPEQAWITNVTIKEDTCNKQNTTQVNFRYLQNNPKDFEWKCVKVEGFYQGRALFNNFEDLYAPYPTSNKALAKSRIGVLAEDEIIQELYEKKHDGEITIVGKFTTCEQLASRMGGFFMGSYCHYTGGPVILVASYRR